MLVSNSLGLDLIGVTVALVAIFMAYCKWTYQYWHRNNVPYLAPQIPFGNVSPAILGKQNFGVTMKDLYQEMKTKGWKYGGIFVLTAPHFIPLSLDLVKDIMAKDFQYFTDRTTYYNEKEDPLSAHLVNLRGTKWRNLRAKLTPTFTSGKMKMMFPTVANCQVNLLKKMDEECAKKEPIDIKEILACFTTDIIGSCAFGLNFKSFDQENSPFRIYGRKIFDETTTHRLKTTFCFNFPNLALFLKMCLTPSDVSQFFMKVVEDTVNYREKNRYVRNDFMQLLIDMKNSDESLTMEEVAAQSFVFFLAGFETSSTLMTFALYELAKHQDIQRKVREEIERVLAKHEGKITYEAIQDMKYLNQVIDETFRLHPPVPITNRMCVKDYKLRDQDIVIKKGTKVIIPIMGIHYDEEYYPDPEKFDPERFSEENKNSRHGYAHLPFGEGPRICIGLRFGLMQAKVGLSCLVKNYKLTVNRKTMEPLEMEPNGIILSTKGDLWLNAEKL